jgi:lysophospholipase L1-like esterase
MPFARLLCAVLTIATLFAACSGTPTSPTAILPDVTAPVASSQSSTDTYAPSLVIPAPRAIGVSKLVAFGDSITWGAMSAFDANYIYAAANGGYVERLENSLNVLHPPQHFSVFNDGLPGELALNGVARFRSMLTSRRPEGVLLLEGINDISNGFSPTSTANALRQMLDAAAQFGVPVAIATMYQTYSVTDPSGGFRDNGAPFVPAFNAEIRRIAAGRPNVVLVDLEPIMRERRFVGGDGIHTEDAGFTVMANAFLSAIENAYPVRGSFQ